MKSASDPFDLKRFVYAQAPVYRSVVEELRAGRKRGHWMWFVFPQLRGLGSSPLAVRYGISSLEEAQAYLQHDLLGPRLHECTGLVNQVQGRSIEEIFGPPRRPQAVLVDDPVRPCHRRQPGLCRAARQVLRRRRGPADGGITGGHIDRAIHRGVDA